VRATKAARSSALILPLSVAIGSRLAPPVNNAGALFSSTAIWAMWWQTTAFQGWAMVDSARQLAAVPVVTKNTFTGVPKASPSMCSARWLHSSLP